jgi:argininosuccinate lyase
MNKKNSQNTNSMWGGRFKSGPSAIMEKINASIDFDKILYKHDIQGSIAHATMLAKQNIISNEDKELILKGLGQIKNEIESGEFEFKTSLEDIHMNIESRLKEIIGDAGGRLHTGRSRNDQVAVDFRLWLRDDIKEIDDFIKDLQESLINKAEEHADTVMPGFTHLQTAQPVTLGHVMLAYTEMMGRDRSRLSDCSNRMNECPLGSAALAGTPYPIDRFMTAEALNFDRPCANSLDGVSDRDFAMEFLSNVSICAIHLSRLAEELIIWASSRFSFIRMADDFSTGSSIMPQKRNPDAAELTRARAGRIIGNLNSLLIVMKGLSLAYSKDMQEDKEPVFEASNSIKLCLSAMKGMIDGMKPNKEVMKMAAGDGFSTATDLADWLVRKIGVPFRDAHHITGEIVKIAEDKNCRLEDLSIQDFVSVDDRITDDIFNVLGVDNSVKGRQSYGGTAPENVKHQAGEAKKRFL